MKTSWLKLLSLIDARSPRERILLLGAGLVIIALVADTFFLSPSMKITEIQERQTRQQQSELARLDAELLILQHTEQYDPNTENRTRVLTLEQELTRQKAQLQEHMKGFVSPSEMNRLLHALVSSTGGLTLHGIRSLSPEPLSPAADSDQGNPSLQSSDEPLPTVWKRGAEIELHGDYNALLTYVKSIETMPWQLNWDSLTTFNPTQNGTTPRFVLRVHTLSLSEDWIGAY